MKEIAKMSIGELAAFVCSHLQKQGIEVVLTGGGCVEIYSSGKYSSFDLDFIENVPVGGRKLGKVMEEIQFSRKDRYFVHPDTRYFIEFPVGPLAVGSEQPIEISVLVPYRLFSCFKTRKCSDKSTYLRAARPCLGCGICSRIRI